MKRIGFLGAGKMAQALAKGFLNAGLIRSEFLIASCAPSDKGSINAFKELGSKITFRNAEVVLNSDVVLLAVKPNVVATVLLDIKNHISEEKLLLSIAMGVTLETLENILPRKCKVIRTMPNTPAFVQQGATVFSPGSFATEEDINFTTKLFQTVGTCDQAPEYLMDTVTALSGSGPAYVYVIIEAMADGAVRMGMPRDLAYKLSSQTVLGASKMVLSTGEHPAKLKDDVTSPAGSTAEGLNCLEEAGIRSAMIRAIEKATKKCNEVSYDKRSA